MPTTTAPAEARFRAMGSDVHVLVVDGPPDLLGRARDRVGELERRWSRFRPTARSAGSTPWPGHRYRSRR